MSAIGVESTVNCSDTNCEQAGRCPTRTLTQSSAAPPAKRVRLRIDLAARASAITAAVARGECPTCSVRLYECLVPILRGRKCDRCGMRSPVDRMWLCSLCYSTFCSRCCVKPQLRDGACTYVDADDQPLVESKDLLDDLCFERILSGIRPQGVVRPRVALATCTRGCPAARLREWLFWHLSWGVSHIFLRWEGEMNPEQQQALQGPMERSEVVLTRVTNGKLSSGFQAVMRRQVLFVHRALRLSQTYGCDFMLHLDDDELLCPRNATASIPDVFQKHLGSAKTCIHFTNLEAVFQYRDQGSISAARPLSQPGACFRCDNHVLYCNGKSAANLSSGKPVYASGVHHFCRYNRSFSEPSPKFGLHDDGGGCTHPDCCVTEDAAVVLHFDCPSFEEWRAKFRGRAASKLSRDDRDEMKLFPFKLESIRVLRRRKGSLRAQRAVYRRWRCLPGRRDERFDPHITGRTVESRLRSRVLAFRRAMLKRAPARLHVKSGQ
eukprot:gnl/TRDRNA2_/TRDRNA2_68798_c0_seq1.p1 gnl/TRDRNA2_/TRDRNA2_68798_c0~~gnl/TRDRNA2_/TRDRNA2_68798_c0_seq1.p1  ORF type:complete len:494 (-),score=43.16 gnl/TRDRNA2_/TRDRNA2_68798_c0_seq1:143-1624(-)